MLKQILASILSVGGLVAYGDLIIDNAGTVSPTWTLATTHAISAGVTADGQGPGGVGQARMLVFNTEVYPENSARYSTAENIAGNQMAYLNSTLQFDYKTLGVGGGDVWTPTASVPVYFSVYLYGGPSDGFIAWDMKVGDTNSLGWDTNQQWHTVSLPIINGLPSRAGSFFDGVAATTATLPTATVAGNYWDGLQSQFWTNLTSISVIMSTNYDPVSPNNEAVLIDNLRLASIPEPCSLALLALSALFVFRGGRRHGAK